MPFVPGVSSGTAITESMSCSAVRRRRQLGMLVTAFVIFCPCSSVMAVNRVRTQWKNHARYVGGLQRAVSARGLLQVCLLANEFHFVLQQATDVVKRFRENVLSEAIFLVLRAK